MYLQIPLLNEIASAVLNRTRILLLIRMMSQVCHELVEAVEDLIASFPSVAEETRLQGRAKSILEG